MTDGRNHGRLIAVVGASGVGKDSVMAGLKQAMSELALVRRVITRAPELGGEDYEHVSVAQFEQARVEGAYCLHWGAHGLFYGIPKSVVTDVAQGQDCLVNLSRGVLAQAASQFAELVVFNVTADEATLAARLKARGRESADEITRRLAQANKPLPASIQAITLKNDGPLADTVARALHALAPVPEILR